MILRIGIIGCGSHARRLKSILDLHENILSVKFYHPNKKFSNPDITNNLLDLLNCDAIFVVSPNATHYEYLCFLSVHYQGYIFCEKPPITQLEEISFLETLTSKKIFFNFNYRFSDYATTILNSIVTKEVGRPISAFVASTHGLAYKNFYAESWRASRNNELGIIQNVGIHFVDLFIYLFGEISSIETNGVNCSGKGLAFDTATIRVKFQMGFDLTIFVSYATPFSERMILYGDNGILDFDNDVLRIRSPRNTFDDFGSFQSPPERSICIKNLYTRSLEASVKYFISVCNDKGNIDESHLSTSIQTCKALLT